MFETIKMLDENLLVLINSHHTAFLDLIFWQLSENWPTILFVGVFGFFFYKKFKIKNLLAMLLGVAIVIACCDLSSNAIKHSVKRLRPTHNNELKEKIHLVNNYQGGNFGFVSSHAANSFGIITYLFFCATWMAKKRKILFFIYPIIVVYSRIYLGVHYPIDIIGGALLGLIFGTIVFKLIERHFFKLSHDKT